MALQARIDSDLSATRFNAAAGAASSYGSLMGLAGEKKSAPRKKKKPVLMLDDDELEKAHLAIAMGGAQIMEAEDLPPEERPTPRPAVKLGLVPMGGTAPEIDPADSPLLNVGDDSDWGDLPAALDAAALEEEANNPEEGYFPEQDGLAEQEAVAAEDALAQPEIDTEIEPQIDTENEAEIEAELLPAVDFEPVAEISPEPEDEPMADFAPKPERETELEADAEAEAHLVSEEDADFQDGPAFDLDHLMAAAGPGPQEDDDSNIPSIADQLKNMRGLPPLPGFNDQGEAAAEPDFASEPQIEPVAFDDAGLDAEMDEEEEEEDDCGPSLYINRLSGPSRRNAADDGAESDVPSIADQMKSMPTLPPSSEVEGLDVAASAQDFTSDAKSDFEAAWNAQPKFDEEPEGDEEAGSDSSLNFSRLMGSSKRSSVDDESNIPSIADQLQSMPVLPPETAEADEAASTPEFMNGRGAAEEAGSSISFGRMLGSSDNDDFVEDERDIPSIEDQLKGMPSLPTAGIEEVEFTPEAEFDAGFEDEAAPEIEAEFYAEAEFEPEAYVQPEVEAAPMPEAADPEPAIDMLPTPNFGSEPELEAEAEFTADTVEEFAADQPIEPAAEDIYLLGAEDEAEEEFESEAGFASLTGRVSADAGSDAAFDPEYDDGADLSWMQPDEARSMQINGGQSSQLRARLIKTEEVDAKASRSLIQIVWNWIASLWR